MKKNLAQRMAKVAMSAMEPNGQAEDLFAIDLDRLEEEWVRHPRNYRRFAQEAADAQEELERAKARKELVAAEIDKDVRQDPQSFGLDEITERAVANAVILSDRYQKANNSLIKAKHKVDVSDVAVKTLDHKKKALEKVVDLWLAEYFATPRSKAMRKHQEGTPSFNRRKR